jgi:ribosomal protein S18 acetylase RimI-like enzyme
VPAVLALWETSRSEASVTEDTAEAVVALIEQPGSVLLLAFDEGAALVGTLVVGWDGWRGNMYRLAVLPSHRRLGIAGELVAAGEASLRARGARRITALVGRGDAVAMALWRSAGYAHDAQIARFVKNV